MPISIKECIASDGPLLEDIIEYLINFKEPYLISSLALNYLSQQITLPS